MAQKPINFASGQESGNEALGGATPLVCNILIDDTGAMRTRPGISAWADFPTVIPNASPVVAMAMLANNLLYVTQDRKLWALLSPGYVVALSDGTAATQLDGSTRPVPITTKTRVVIAGGGAPQKWEGAGLSARLLGKDTSPPIGTPPLPPATTHIVSLNTHLIAGDRSPYGQSAGRIYWSNPFESGNEVWDPINFSELASRPDPVVALYDSANQAFGFGTSTTEILRADPSTGAFVTARTLDVGCAAPYSPIRLDDKLYWIADKSRFVMSTGSSFNELSDPIDGTLDAFSTVNDAWGFELRKDSWRQPCWVFPTEGRALTLDPKAGRWAEMRSFGAAGYAPLAVSSSFLWEERRLPLVGLPSGQIARWDATASTDLGATIKAEVVTGYHSRETGNLKACNHVTLAFKRGAAAPGTSPIAQLSWRDDGGAWSNRCTVSLGAAGDTDPVVTLRTLGTYRMRQWRIEFTDAANFTFVGAQEDYTVLDS